MRFIIWLRFRWRLWWVVDNYRSINALAESVNGAYKAEMVRDRLFELVGQLEAETVGWVAWWNQVRLHQGLGYRMPQEVVVGVLSLV